MIHQTVNSSKWVQIGSEHPFGLPLKKEGHFTEYSEDERSVSHLKDKAGNVYSLTVQKSGSNDFTFSIDDMNGKNCFKQGPRSIVRIQPLTEAEADKIHEKAHTVLDVYYV